MIANYIQCVCKHTTASLRLVVQCGYRTWKGTVGRTRAAAQSACHQVILEPQKSVLRPFSI